MTYVIQYHSGKELMCAVGLNAGELNDIQPHVMDTNIEDYTHTQLIGYMNVYMSLNRILFRTNM